MRTLVCDDSRTQRMWLGAVLADLGYDDVAEAVDGQDALERVRSERFDLVLLDIHTPRLDGIGFLEAVRRLDPPFTGAVVIVSTDTDPRTMQRARDLGIAGYVRKPVQFEALEEMLDSLGLADQNSARKA